MEGVGFLPKSAEATANFLLFIDKVFDSVNETQIQSIEGKQLRCAVTTDSPHVNFWYEAIQVFDSMKFIKGDREFIPPTVKNWVLTLHSFICIWNKLKNVGFQFLCPRNLNRDPIENFF